MYRNKQDHKQNHKQGALGGLKIIDLSRVLAGPYCTQMLGDMGANVIKIERPDSGDDTRYWGPPFLKDKAGQDTSESAYYLSCNRNKRSVAIDISTAKGQEAILGLLEDADVLIQNFKVDGLDKYGLSYDQLKDKYPQLIYCSISGFGQNGPLAHEPGYDFIAQGMAGLMACTGAADQPPTKVGVALSDIMTGLNAAIGILAALNHRHASGEGQHVDVALTDCTLAALTNIAQYYLTSGQNAPRVGNAHSTIVPYEAFETADGYVIIGVGNDRQFERFSKAIGHPEWSTDARFQTNRARVEHRDILVPMIRAVIKAKTASKWLTLFDELDVPAAPVNTMDQVFAMTQIQAREMKIQMDHPYAPEKIDLVGSPLKFSKTPVRYTYAPPTLGEHTKDVLGKIDDGES
jgi:crotonobetainyl-CoA:carnitine CoA-transferase CaiB-like acyl-CoA transferase